MGIVSFVHTKASTINEIKNGINQSLVLINFKFDKTVNKIVIKPNLCYYYHPSTGEVTDPRFVSALIELLQERFSNAQIYVVESDASAMRCKYAFRMIGYDKLVDEYGVELVNLSATRSSLFDIVVDDWHLRFSIPELLQECDMLVNVPKLKYIGKVKITSALKNIYGCNAYNKKSVYHKALSEAIVGINKLLKTHLVLVDGLVVCGKYVKKLNLIMASEDPVSIDVAAARLLGISSHSLKQIELASREGVGRMNFIPVGDYESFRNAFPKRKFKDNLRRSLSSTYLRVFHE